MFGFVSTDREQNEVLKGVERRKTMEVEDVCLSRPFKCATRLTAAVHPQPIQYNTIQYQYTMENFKFIPQKH